MKNCGKLFALQKVFIKYINCYSIQKRCFKRGAFFNEELRIKNEELWLVCSFHLQSLSKFKKVYLLPYTKTLSS